MSHRYDPRPLIGLEHPYIINNVDKCIRSLGGDARIADVGSTPMVGEHDIDAFKLVKHPRDSAIATLYNRPDDKLAIPILSGSVATHDLLLKVTVPKMVGRKRKRENESATGIPNGTQDSREDSSTVRPAQRLRQALQDNQETFTTEVVGKIERTHRFRDLPDYVVATSTGSFVQRFQNTLTTYDYDKIKQFWLDPSNPKRPTEIVPPTRLTPYPISFNYHYNQNPTVRRMIDPKTGKVELVNDALIHKILTPRISWDTKEVPSQPPAGLTPLGKTNAITQDLVKQLEKLLAERPIWTRRSLLNHIDREHLYSVFKFAYQYVAYMFRSGPWREAIVRLGLDPRKDPAMRIYQTMMFQFENEVESLFIPRGNTVGKSASRAAFRDRGTTLPTTQDASELGNRSHIFDGVKVGLDGRVWQVCDITDPLIVSIFDTTFIRKRCHMKSDGWFHNGTWAKARVICKEKMRAIVCKEELNEDYVERLAMVPETLEDRSRIQTLVIRGDSDHFITLAEQLRNFISTPDGGRRNGNKVSSNIDDAEDDQADSEVELTFYGGEANTKGGGGKDRNENQEDGEDDEEGDEEDGEGDDDSNDSREEDEDIELSEAEEDADIEADV